MYTRIYAYMYTCTYAYMCVCVYGISLRIYILGGSQMSTHSRVCIDTFIYYLFTYLHLAYLFSYLYLFTYLYLGGSQISTPSRV